MNAQQTGRLIERVENIYNTVGRIDATVNGNGKEGLVIKVDRNTHTLSNAKKLFWICITAAITASGAALIVLL